MFLIELCLNSFQLFQNLITNAIKFRKKDEKAVVNIGVDEKEDEFIFCVEDNGIGMKEDHLKNIFVIFQRLHSNKEYQGTGIGLAICKRIAEHHGGEIWVESELGKGSKFYFSIAKKDFQLN